ncbi:hypothetical protein K3G63_22430 [Hymenobacter sp. HSC-4F20]|uniref:hypothetical protein n=1 Tax=Hymenobacter sp. HSC-4F20 TaxID=2864135 RepID=UPI001C7384A9|nr:hypothetical protein [Hymenobacter sp. HSC-4F20]MBX0293219.1 hypothetical protein [Hymenobacter sp. HSC-4F20]
MPDITSFSSQYPVLLFPVRVQVKFVRNPQAPHELRVRFYPDQIGISTHECGLTPAEIEDAKRYWEQADPEGKSRTALHSLPLWRGLVEKYGSPRALWIVRQLRPTNLDAMARDLTLTPQFPTPEEATDSWTEAAYSRVMPHHFSVVLYDQADTGAEVEPFLRQQLLDKLQAPYNDARRPGLARLIPNPTSEFLVARRVVEGRAISADKLTVGFDPQLSGVEAGITGLDEGNAWTVDFPKAVEQGMALSIPLSDEEYERGFKRLVVVGVREDVLADGTPTSGRLHQILHDHRFTDGLALVPQGTPTNNADADGAGFSSDEQFDADASFALLTQSAPGPDTDGGRLATALGLPEAILGDALTVAHATTTDGQEAVRMNQALWPATYGYYLEQMLRPLLSLPAIDWVRSFFERYVSGRGPLPAFRVGNEPYSVLPTTRFSAWEAPASPNHYATTLQQVLRRLDVTWTERLNQQGLRPAGLYPTTVGAAAAQVALPAAPTDQQNLLTVLGADATSVEYYQRYMMGPVMADSLNAMAVARAQTIWSSQKRTKARFGSNEAPLNPLYEEFRTLLDTADSAGGTLGLTAEQWPVIFDQVFQTTFSQVAHSFADQASQERQLGSLIDDQPLSETEGLAPLPNLDKNYIEWLATASFDDIRRENLPYDGPRPQALLYRFLRQAVLLQYWDAAMRLLRKTDEERAEKELFNILQQDTAPWEWLYHDYNGQQLHLALQADQGIQDYLAAVKSLAILPTARLERLLAEHLDLGNYRIDAWKIAQVAQQLTTLRQTRPEGSYLGAFSWLEDVKPADQSVAGPDGVRLDPDNLGFIHAPTLNHATAAAILRQGYKSRQLTTEAEDPAAKRMAVNLSSERVRKALAVLDGIRAGQNLAAVLGQEFEASLLQTPARVEGRPYGAYLPIFRTHFPQAKSQALSQQAASAEAAPEQAARQVVDGLALLQAYDTSAYPYGIADLPAATPENAEFVAAVDQHLAALADTLDALGDLTVGESMYQAVLGNADRAAGMLESVAKGQFPVNPEIVHPPHTGNSITHRVLLHLPATRGAWEGVALTPRASAEPRINNWLAGFFGNPAAVSFSFIGTTDAPTAVSGSDKLVDEETGAVESVMLAELGLQPIDLLYLLEPGQLQAGSALEQLLLRALRRKQATTPRTNAGVVVTAWALDYESAGVQALRRLLPLAGRLRQLLGGTRPALPDDLRAPSQLTGTPAATSEPVGVEQAEVQDRLHASFEALQALSEQLNGQLELTAPLSSAEQANLRELFYRVSLYGVPEASQALSAKAELLLNSLSTVARAVAARVAAAEKAFDQEGSLTDRYTAVGQALFGPAYRLSLMVETPAGYAQAVTPARATQLLRAHPDNPLLLQEWLQGVACVREPLDQLEKVSLMNDLLWAEEPGYQPLDLQPAQLSAGAGPDDYWLGVRFPSNYEAPRDALSLVQVLPAGYQPADTTQCALWVDEWTEILPQNLETTGLSFHYDQPNTEAPQSLLLVVSPRASTPTSTWSFEDLLGAINETLDLAKKRTVEPDSLAFTHLGTVLPALVAPVAQAAATFTLDFRQIKQAAQDPARFGEEPLAPANE